MTLYTCHDIVDMIDNRYSIKVLRYSHVNISRYDDVIYA